MKVYKHPGSARTVVGHVPFLNRKMGGMWWTACRVTIFRGRCASLANELESEPVARRLTERIW